MEKITVSALKIGGKVMPTPAPEGVTISKEKIWSSDRGITERGRRVGTLVRISTTVDIKWPHLTPSQVAAIEAAVSDPSKAFTTMEITDLTGKKLTMEVEFGTPSGTWFSWAPGLQYIKDYSVTAMER